MNNIPDNVRAEIEDLKESIKTRLTELKAEAGKDVQIDEFDVDTALLDTPKLYSKWNEYFTDETMNLKNLYTLKERVKLERWKYYMGKQDAKYYHNYGQVHESILKSDVDKYLSADEKIALVNELVSAQKALADFIERTMKEIGNRGFHCKGIIDWRKFTSGA